jgi:hypothetical protein
MKSFLKSLLSFLGVAIVVFLCIPMLLEPLIGSPYAGAVGPIVFTVWLFRRQIRYTREFNASDANE